MTTSAPASLLSLVICPACGTGDSLSASGKVMDCAQCSVSFPVHASGGADIPWLFADPAASLLEWKARFNGFLHVNSSQQLRLKDALADKRLSKTGKQRIKSTLQARKAQREQVAGILEPLGLDSLSFDHAGSPADLLRSKLPKNQGVSSYYDNIFRDWSWENGENERLFDSVVQSMQPAGMDRLGKVLTLGAGASRLPYDLHRRHSPELSVVLDINPLLLFLAGRVIHGETVLLHEFPIAPLNKASFAVQQNCSAPGTPDAAFDERFLFVCADGMNPPFKAGSFDTVVTPWFIDIIPQNLREFIPRVNRLLGKGGIWANTGSLAFFHGNESWCYSEEEVLELLDRSGFEVLAATRERVPYLQSPLSAHGRSESVFSFSARKIRDTAVPPRYEYLPRWILDTSQQIPDLGEFVVASTNHLLKAQVFAAIDGKRSIEDIGQLVARQYGLDPDEAANAVKRILIEAYEEGATHKAGFAGGSG